MKSNIVSNVNVVSMPSTVSTVSGAVSINGTPNVKVTNEVTTYNLDELKTGFLQAYYDGNYTDLGTVNLSAQITNADNFVACCLGLFFPFLFEHADHLVTLTLYYKPTGKANKYLKTSLQCKYVTSSEVIQYHPISHLTLDLQSIS